MAAMGPPTPAARALAQLRDLVRSLPAKEYNSRLSAFQQAMAADVLGRLAALAAVANPEPPELADLPEGLVNRFVGKHGCYAMQIYTKADIWNMDAMEKFVREVRSIDRDVTGNPLQIYEASRQMKTTYEKGALYAVLAVLAVVYLDFRNLRLSLLALLPLAASKLQLFGLMGWLGIPLNPANMIVLPLILGVGVDNGVHIVHDYLRERVPGRPYRISASTGAAIVINTLQNIVGFGGLMIASHRGLHSLGRVLTLGMACCLISGLVMPALLRILQGRAGRTAAGGPPRVDVRIDPLVERPDSRSARPVSIRRRADSPV
jgi:hypothetical protein